MWILLVTLADGKEAPLAQYPTKEHCEYRALDFQYSKVKTRCEERKVKDGKI
jgi:hypothetical protein